MEIPGLTVDIVLLNILLPIVLVTGGLYWFQDTVMQVRGLTKPRKIAIALVLAAAIDYALLHYSR